MDIIMNIITMIMTTNTIMKSMNIITTMSAAADIIMITTIIMQTRYLQAGDVRRLRSIPERVWKRFLPFFLSQRSMRDSSCKRNVFRLRRNLDLFRYGSGRNRDPSKVRPEYTGRLCVIGSKLKEEKLAEIFGL